MDISRSEMSVATRTLWQQHRETLSQLYERERKPLREVRRIMEDEYSFPHEIPNSTWHENIAKLGLRKKLKRPDWVAISQYLVAHRAQSSKVYLNNVLIPDAKVKREINRELKRPTSRRCKTGTNLPLPAGITIEILQQRPSEVDFLGRIATPEHPLQNNHDNTAEGRRELSRSMSPYGMRMSPFISHATEGNTISCMQNHSSTLVQQTLFEGMMKLGVTENPFALKPSDAVLFNKEFSRGLSRSLENLPTFQFQSFIFSLADTQLSNGFSFMGPMVHTLGNDGSITVQELEWNDAAELGLSRRDDSLADNLPIGDFRISSQPSRHVDSFYALRVIMYHLSNRFEKDDVLCPIMNWLVSQVPLPLLSALLRLESATMRESWRSLLDWAFHLQEEKLFLAVMDAAMNDADWIRFHGPYCLILAAWFNQTQLCEQLLQANVSPNEVSAFPPKSSSELETQLRLLGKNQPTTARCFQSRVERPSLTFRNREWEKSFPLCEAAVQGHVDCVQVLLDGGALVDLRCFGYTAVGVTMLAIGGNRFNGRNHPDVVRQLLEKGADVHAPFWETPEAESLGMDWEYEKPIFSEESLSDIVYLIGCPPIVEVTAQYWSLPASVLTIAGIIFNAEQGTDYLRNYMDQTTLPGGLRRRWIEEVALSSSFDKPKAFSSMIHAGVGSAMQNIKSLFYARPGTLEKIYLDPGNLWEGNMGITKCSIADLSDDTISLILNRERSASLAIIKPCLQGGELGGVERLINNGLDVSGDDGILMMADAARRDNFEMVRLLKHHGVDVNGTIYDQGISWSVLLLTVSGYEIENDLGLLGSTNNSFPSIDMLSVLQSAGADINTCIPILEDDLDDSSQAYYDEIQSNGSARWHYFEWLIGNGLEIAGASIYYIMTRVLMLEPHEYIEALQGLRRSGVHIISPDELPPSNQPYPDSYHPLSYFIELNPDTGFIGELLDTGICVNGKSWRNLRIQTPLRAALLSRNLEIVKELLSRGAVDTDEHGNINHDAALCLACGQTPKDLIVPIQSHNSQQQIASPLRFPIEIAQIFLDKGADPNTTMWEPPLVRALLSMDVDFRLIELLLAYGADVNLPTPHARGAGSVLHAALMTHHPPETKLRVAKILLSNGADANWRSLEDVRKVNMSSPIEAISDDSPDLLELLIEYKADVHPSAHNYGSCSLESAAEREFVRLTRALLAQNASPRECDALAIAAEKGNIPIALLLLEGGAKVCANQTSRGSAFYRGRCPLSAAAGRGKLDMVMMLLEWGPSEKAMKDAAIIARHCGYIEIGKNIEKHRQSLGPSRVEEVGEASMT